jgi:hypothetical protein
MERTPVAGFETVQRSAVTQSTFDLRCRFSAGAGEIVNDCG